MPSKFADSASFACVVCFKLHLYNIYHSHIGQFMYMCLL